MNYNEFLKIVFGITLTLGGTFVVIFILLWANSWLNYRIPLRRAAKSLLNNDFESAQQQFNQFLEKHPKYAPAIVAQASVCVARFDYVPAYENLERALAINPRVSGAYVLRGLSYLYQRQFDKSINSLNEGLNFPMQRPQKSRAYVYRGYSKLGKAEVSDDDSLSAALIDEALSDFKAALRVNPANTDAVSGIAFTLKQKGELDSAFASFEEMIRARPQAANLYVDRGSLHNSLKNYDAALADYQKAIQLRPEFALAHNGAGYVYGLLGAYDQSLAACSKAIELYQRSYLAYGSRGHTYLLMGQFAEALSDFEKSTQVKPDHPFALAGQAICHYKLGYADLAKVAWESLLAVDQWFQNPEMLQKEYHCADAFVEAARDVAQ